MPLPTPMNNESMDEFMSRCMGDDMTHKEYPEQKQRAAVCSNLWDKHMNRASTDHPETRTVNLDAVQIIAEETKAKRLVGHAAVFNTSAMITDSRRGQFEERIAPGAFADALAGSPDVWAFFNHDRNLILGRTSAGTLALREDDRGLQVDITPPDTTVGRDALVNVQTGHVNKMSFSFRVKDGGETWEARSGKPPLRTLTKVHLVDVSPVTFEAYKDTDISARSAEAWDQANATPARNVADKRLKLMEAD